ncbi:hypothetical protein T08_9214 [Trichinella sp. T8]|nr:hypothetical protein T08_9214 [Trichinella sp. T8]
MLVEDTSENGRSATELQHSIQHPLTSRWAIAIGRLTLTVICAFFYVKQSRGTLVVLIIDHCQILWNLEKRILNESAL